MLLLLNVLFSLTYSCSAALFLCPVFLLNRHPAHSSDNEWEVCEPAGVWSCVAPGVLGIADPDFPHCCPYRMLEMLLLLQHPSASGELPRQQLCQRARPTLPCSYSQLWMATSLSLSLSLDRPLQVLLLRLRLTLRLPRMWLVPHRHCLVLHLRQLRAAQSQQMPLCACRTRGQRLAHLG